MRTAVVSLVVLVLFGASLPCAATERTRPGIRDGTPEVLIIAPQNRLVHAAYMAEAAQAWGVIPYIETIEDVRGWWPGDPDTTAIRREIRYWFEGWPLMTSYVLLVGGWSYYDSYAQFREIPTIYRPVGTLGSYPTYRAPMDPLLGDWNGDGIPEIVPFRVVFRTNQEAAAYRDKAIAYKNVSTGQDWTRRVRFHCDDQTYGGGCPPATARELTAALPAAVGGTFTADPIVWRSDFPHPSEDYKLVLPNDLATGKAVIVAAPSTFSCASCWLCFNPDYWRFSQAAANSRWPLMIGASCHLGAWDYYLAEDDDWAPYSREWLHVTDYRKGPIAWIGPSRGSYQYVNAWFTDMMLRLMTSHGHTFGQALRVAQQQVGYWHPEVLYAIQCYSGIGLPFLKLPRSGPLVGVADEPSAGFQLSLSPNPVRPDGTLRIHWHPVESPARASIFSIDGRRVRVLAPASPGAMAWDTRDAAGRPVASGIYFVRFTADGFETKRTVVVVR